MTRTMATGFDPLLLLLKDTQKEYEAYNRQGFAMEPAKKLCTELRHSHNRPWFKKAQ